MNFKYFIKDNQESSSIKEAIALLESKVGMSHEKADGYVRNDIRAAFPVLRTKHGGKFILGVTRLFVEKQLNDADTQNKLTRCLEEIDTDEHYNEYDRNLNGLSLDKLYTTFKDVISAKDKESRKKSEGKQYDSSNYQIYGPYTSFEQARKDWGNESQHWCVFHDENQYGYYTSAGQQFYVAAQNGWEDIPREVGKNAPKDAYGNSLIAVSVDLNGNLATATPRWNHDNDDDNVDHTYTVDELESIIQKPFYKTFLPKKSETVATFGENNIVKVLKADDKIKYYIGSEGCSEGNFSTLFDLKGNTLVPKFQDPLKVRINDKYNFLDTSGKILFDQWFDVAWSFSEGFASVKLNNKYNYIDIKGHLLSKQWFDFAMDFSEGVAPVALNNKYNFIDTKGNLLSNQWFDWAGMFKEGFVLVKLNNKSNFIDTKGHLLSNQWFDFATSFKEGFARVELDGEWNFIDTKGRLLSEQWFYEVRDFKEGFARVELSGKYNFLDTKGNYLSNQWFDSVRDFKEGFARVELGGGWNFIDTKGKILSEQWFYEAMSFVGGVAQVQLDGDWKHINTKGEIIDSWKSAMGLLKKIKDNQESSSIKEATALLESKVGMSHEKADGYVRNDIRAAFPVLRTKHGGKFILGVTRLFVEKQLNDADTQNKLTRCLEEIDTDEHYNEYDRNLNGLSLDKLYTTFKDVIAQKDEESRKKSEGKQYGKSNYQIWGPYTSFEQANADWGDDSQHWCVFHDEDQYGYYTSADQQFYVAAQNGWEDIPREVGKNAPKDAYGNSLIAVSVDLNGNLATATPRWNHDNDDDNVDHTYTVDELESIIQKPFYKTFLPKKSEVVATFGDNNIVKVLKVDDEVKYLIGSKGYSEGNFSRYFDLKGNALVPKFQESLKVELSGKYNFIDTKGHLLSNQWFDFAGSFSEGFAPVKLNNKYNFIDTKGNLLSKQWFDRVYDFYKGLTVVALDDKYNFLDTSGKILSDQWFDGIGVIKDGLAFVCLNDKWNFIDTSGKLISNQWFDAANDFKEGFAPVKLNNKCNFIDTKGHLLSNQWFDDVDAFKEGFARVELDGEWNFIDIKGNIISKQWFDSVDAFKEGFALVGLNDKYNLVDTKGNIISNQWFDDVNDFNGGIAQVKLNGKWNFLDIKGRLLSNQWFNGVGVFKEGFAWVRLGHEFNFIDTKGNIISKQWFDSVDDFSEGIALVGLNDKYNLVDTKGNILSNQWFDDVNDFNGGIARVELNGQIKHINTKGEIIDSWKSAMGLLKKIKDNQESSSIKEATALLESKAGMSHEKADGYVRNDIRAAFPVLRTKHGGKFILGVTRLFVEQQLNDADTQNKLTRCLEEIDTDAHYNEYDRNLNNLSLDKIWNTFKDIIAKKDEESRKKSEGKQYGKSNYQIWGPYTSFEQAKKDWGNQSQDWCVFHDEDMYGYYTSAGQQFYVAAQNGWEDIPREVGKNAPKDAYGNSLIAISVDLNGNLATSTPRWNHAIDDNADHTYTVDELESIIQKPFYKTFLPKKSETIATFGENNIVKALKVDGVVKYLIGSEGCSEGNFSTLFDLKGNTLVPKFQDPLKVRINDKFNFIDTKGHILYDQWFDYACDFKEGFASVELNNKYNFIDIKGHLLSNQWVDVAWPFSEGFARVILNDKYNFIDTKEHILSDQWFDAANDFKEGFALVTLNGHYKRINTKGQIVDSWKSAMGLLKKIK